MAGRRPGPDVKGDRSQFTTRMPRDHRAVYEWAARQAGLPLGDYLALQLARAHGLDDPDYLAPTLMDALPMGA